MTTDGACFIPWRWITMLWRLSSDDCNWQSMTHTWEGRIILWPLSWDDDNWRSMFHTEWYITILWPLSWEEDNWRSMFHTIGILITSIKKIRYYSGTCDNMSTITRGHSCGSWVYIPSLGGTTVTVECVYKTRRHNKCIGIYSKANQGTTMWLEYMYLYYEHLQWHLTTCIRRYYSCTLAHVPSQGYTTVWHLSVYIITRWHYSDTSIHAPSLRGTKDTIGHMYLH